MSSKTNAHRRGRNARSLEEHTHDRGSSSLRRRRSWRFYDLRHSFTFAGIVESHFRPADRAAALDGKHMRSVRHAALESHVKNA